MTELTCIVCPMGCTLQITEEAGGITVTGNSCPRGAQFGKAELTDPHRSLTTTVHTTMAALPLLPVRTDGEIPKAMVAQAMAELAKLRVDHPVKAGEVVLPDLLGTGVAVIATATMPETDEIKRAESR